MTSRLSRLRPLAIMFLASATAVRAHPGHEGHELTWDLSHLVEHPAATLVCFGLLVGAGWGAWMLLRRAATERIYSLRGSQPSRGK